MSTVPDELNDVHSNPHDVPFVSERDDESGWLPFAADSAWWAEVAADAPPATAYELSDRAWVWDESAYWAGRATPAEFDFAAFVSTILRTVAESMAFHRAYSAGQIAKVKRADLGKVWVQGVGSRRSALAEALDVEATYYLHLDTDAGRLAAWRSSSGPTWPRSLGRRRWKTS